MGVNQNRLRDENEWGGRKGVKQRYRRTISEILKTLRLCVRRTRCWNFLNILNVTISSELLWPAAPPCPAGLVLVTDGDSGSLGIAWI